MDNDLGMLGFDHDSVTIVGTSICFIKKSVGVNQRRQNSGHDNSYSNIYFQAFSFLPIYLRSILRLQFKTMCISYLIVAIMALQSSITFSEHFTDLEIEPFRYSGSITLPSNDHYVVKPQSMLVYSSGTTLKIQPLTKDHSFDGSPQEKTHGSQINEIHVSPDGEKIFILDGENKIYFFSRNQQGSFDDQTEVMIDAASTISKLNVNNNGLIFLDGHIYYSYSMSNSQKNEIYEISSPQWYQISQIAISKNLEYQYFNIGDIDNSKQSWFTVCSQGNCHFYFFLMLNSHVIPVNLTNSDRKDKLFSIRYNFTDDKAKLLAHTGNQNTTLFHWQIKETSSSSLLKQLEETYQYISPNQQFIIINWFVKHAFKLLNTKNMNAVNTFHLTDFFINQNLIAKFIQTSDGVDYLQVGNKEDITSIDLYTSCHYSCMKCQNAICTCDSAQGRQIDEGQGQCKCMNNYVDRGKQVCCHPLCEQCSDTPQKCTSCSTAQQRVLKNNQCKCQDGLFDDGVNLNCQSCHPSCKTCEGSAENNACLSCSSDEGVERTLNNGKCLCNDGFFDDGVNLNCQSCHPSCKTCKGSANTDCLSCDDGYYYDGDNLKCHACHSSCKTCSGSAENNACLSCYDKFYHDSVNLECKACHYSCAACYKQPSNCIRCDINLHRYANGPECLCQIGYFDKDSQTQKCQTCDSTCKTCHTVSSNCTSCNLESNRILNKNTCICKDKYFVLSAQNQICSPCDYTCKTCSNLKDNCTSCNKAEKRQLLNTKCVCRDGYFDDQKENETCQACNISCATCLNSHTCTTCQIKYFDNGNKLCQPCKYSCATCAETSSNCTSCNSIAHRVKDADGCMCKDGYFDDGTDQQLCSKCHQSCATCSNLNSCDSCSLGFQRYGGQRQSLCFQKNLNVEVMGQEKLAAKNQVRLYFQLSVPTKISEKDTRVEIVSHQNSTESITWEATQEDESSVTLFITYNETIQKRTIKVTFYALIETQRRALAVLVPVYEGQVEIETYPPANIVSENEIEAHDTVKNAILGSSASLLILCIICLLIPRAQFYTFKYSWTTPKLFIAFGICPQSITEWVKYSLQPITQISYVLGFKTYQCCSETEFLGYTANISDNSGIPISILLVLWILYLPIRFCLKKPKIVLYYRLFIVTAVLILLPHCLFAAINGFNDSANNQLSATNIVVACFLMVLFLLFFVKLVNETLKLRVQKNSRPYEIKEEKQKESIQISIDPQPVKIAIPVEQKRMRDQDLKKWLKASYLNCLSSKSKLVQFYLIFAIGKLFLFCLFCSVLHGGQLSLYVILILVDPVLDLCYLIFTPHKSIIHLLMEMGFHFCWLAIYIVMCIYTSEFSSRVYMLEREKTILWLIFVIIIYAMVLLVKHVILAFLNGEGDKQVARVRDGTQEKLEQDSNVQIKQ